MIRYVTCWRLQDMIVNEVGMLVISPWQTVQYWSISK